MKRSSDRSYPLQSLPEEERPRERFLQYGDEQMSSAELLAILLGSGIRGTSVLQLAQIILSHFGNLAAVAEASIHELLEIKGLGMAKAIQIKAALALAKRIRRGRLKKGNSITSPYEAYDLLRDFFEQKQSEYFVALLLDAKGYVLQQTVIAIGTLCESLVHPREVFYPAIRHKAASVILAHNHPSGDPTPSKEDVLVTKELISVGNLMGIPLRDHLIIGRGKFVSLLQKEGLFYTEMTSKIGISKAFKPQI